MVQGPLPTTAEGPTFSETEMAVGIPAHPTEETARTLHQGRPKDFCPRRRTRGADAPLGRRSWAGREHFDLFNAHVFTGECVRTFLSEFDRGFRSDTRSDIPQSDSNRVR